MKTTLTIKGLDSVKKALEKAGLNTKMAFIGLVADTALGLQTKAKNDAAVDTGRMRSSIQNATYQGGLTQEVFVNAKYGQYVDEGTGRFNGRGSFFPPPDALKGWAARHGMAGKEWAIAKSIKKKGGTKPQPFWSLNVRLYALKYQKEGSRILRKLFPGR